MHLCACMGVCNSKQLWSSEGGWEVGRIPVMGELGAWEGGQGTLAPVDEGKQVQ